MNLDDFPFDEIIKDLEIIHGMDLFGDFADIIVKEFNGY